MLNKTAREDSEKLRKNLAKCMLTISSPQNPTLCINHYLCTLIFKTLGYSDKKAESFSASVFRHYQSQAGANEWNLTTTVEELKKKLEEMRKKYKNDKIDQISNYFFTVARLRLDSQGLIILLGGGSGTGKSSLASLMAAKLSLQVFSTDNIRHTLRNFKKESENPYIFKSTYTADTLISDESLTQEQKILEGYYCQCAEVHEQLVHVLDEYYASGKWVIVEGVHLTSDFMIRCMAKYKNCLGFLISVGSEGNHTQRFISRSKRHSIDPQHNKYVKNIDKIRLIHDSLVANCTTKKIPVIDNDNLDKSVALVHLCFLKSFGILEERGTLVTRGSADYLWNEFKLVQKKVQLAKKVHELINILASSMMKGLFKSEEKSPKLLKAPILRKKKSKRVGVEVEGILVPPRNTQLEDPSPSLSKNIKIQLKEVFVEDDHCAEADDIFDDDDSHDDIFAEDDQKDPPIEARLLGNGNGIGPKKLNKKMGKKVVGGTRVPKKRKKLSVETRMNMNLGIYSSGPGESSDGNTFGIFFGKGGKNGSKNHLGDLNDLEEEAEESFAARFGVSLNDQFGFSSSNDEAFGICRLKLESANALRQGKPPLKSPNPKVKNAVKERPPLPPKKPVNKTIRILKKRPKKVVKKKKKIVIVSDEDEGSNEGGSAMESESDEGCI